MVFLIWQNLVFKIQLELHSTYCLYTCIPTKKHSRCTARSSNMVDTDGYKSILASSLLGRKAKESSTWLPLPYPVNQLPSVRALWVMCCSWTIKVNDNKDIFDMMIRLVPWSYKYYVELDLMQVHVLNCHIEGKVFF